MHQSSFFPSCLDYRDVDDWEPTQTNALLMLFNLKNVSVHQWMSGCVCEFAVHPHFRNTMMGVSTGMNQALIGNNPLATMQGLCHWVHECVLLDCPLWPSESSWDSISKDQFPFHPPSILPKMNFLAKPQYDSSQEQARRALLLLSQTFWIAQYGERFNLILIQ